MAWHGMASHITSHHNATQRHATDAVATSATKLSTDRAASCVVLSEKPPVMDGCNDDCGGGDDDSDCHQVRRTAANRRPSTAVDRPKECACS
mmetsp:Transcript_4356/g.12534  ORF Transcript_4356/g.12534 Transcript_4356/m.12534 type:complete len:92 (+) Transcript_4356:3-278(+)